jgi:hypothetical protein
MTTQTDDTRRILDMLSQGKITVDEADRLIKAVNAAQPTETATAEAAPDDARPARWLRIQIHRVGRDDTHQPKDVNIRVPVAVVKGGMRLGAIISTFAGDKAALRMKERGIDFDIAKINGDLSKMSGAEFDAFLKSLNDMNIEFDDGRSQVRLTCE